MKMIMAILHKDDELETIEELNIAGYMVTKLATTGGFLKKKSTTIMVVVDDEKVAEALKIIKKNSGERKTITYANPALISGQSSMSAAPSVPINVQVGGSTIFVLNVEQMEKFMEIVILSFTDAGCQMACKVRENFIQSGYRVKVYTLTRFCRLYGFHTFPEDKKSWIGSLWGEKALFFIGAAGIAVRMIAPHVKDKFTDSPVLVMDEKGSYVIPLLSGHVGGAVELAKEIAEKINAQAVLTTATDVEQKFAVDVFAKSNGLVLTDRKKAKEISAVVLDGNKIGLYSVFPVEGKFPEELKLCETEEFLRNYPYGIRIAGRSGERREEETILELPPKNLVLGIGCRKGISEEEIQSAVNEAKKILGFTEKEVIEIDSIDLKKEEEGLLSYAAKWKLPFYTFSAEELGKVKCVSSHSEFVRKVTGVDNVCERAAILAAGEDGRLLMPKQCMNRVTIPVAEKKVKIRI